MKIGKTSWAMAYMGDGSSGEEKGKPVGLSRATAFGQTGSGSVSTPLRNEKSGAAPALLARSRLGRDVASPVHPWSTRLPIEDVVHPLGGRQGTRALAAVFT